MHNTPPFGLFKLIFVGPTSKEKSFLIFYSNFNKQVIVNANLNALLNKEDNSDKTNKI